MTSLARLRFVATSALAALVLMLLEQIGGAHAAPLVDFVFLFIIVAALRLAWRWGRRRLHRTRTHSS